MKRNCRRTDDERDQHDRATRIRKMTDAQICSYIDSLAVRTDSGNRISDATIRKIRQMAYEMGFLTEEGGG